jgi:hypothetical protein
MEAVQAVLYPVTAAGCVELRSCDVPPNACVLRELLLKKPVFLYSMAKAGGMGQLANQYNEHS